MGLLLPEGLKRGAVEAGGTMEEEAVILTDILGLEDGLGTMDFKVRHGDTAITAIPRSRRHPGHGDTTVTVTPRSR